MRRVLILAIAAIAAMAAMATTAQAGVVNGTTGAPCPAVSLSGNSVSGGCLVEDMDGTWELEADGVRYAICPLSFDFRSAYGGQMYAINQTGGSCSGFQRVPCTDNTTGEKIPWPGSAIWVPGVGAKEKIDMCFEQPTNPSYHSWEEVTFTPQWAGDDYLDGFNQYGLSENGFIDFANFANTGSRTEVKTDI
jgi:hypothetical protein